MKCDIIIPIWNQLEFTRACIENLIENTAYPYRLILIDNGSMDDTRHYLENLRSRKNLDVELIRNETNLGFVKAVNRGLAESSAEYVCILNNDTIPAPGWLENMVEFGNNHRDVGLMNPQCNGHLDTPIASYAKMLMEKNKGRYMEMNQCQGYCMLIKREVIEKIGYLDEAFGIGGYDDTDYSMRAHKAGYRCVNVYSSYVYHRQHASFDAIGKRESLVAHGEAEYFKKWPRHLRIGLAALSNGDMAEEEIGRLLNMALFLAREWCWVNLFIFGDIEKNKRKISAISDRIKMPLHQNIKFNFLPGLFRELQLLTRLVERSFGTKRRKRYDMGLTNDKRMSSLTKFYYPLHRAEIRHIGLKRDVHQDDMRILINDLKRTRR